MTARRANCRFALSAEQWDSLCADLPDLRKILRARTLFDERINTFRALSRADDETNAPHATKDKLLKIEAAAKKLRSELRSLDIREKINLARLAAPAQSPLLLDNMREFWGERSSLFDGLDRVEKTARRAIEEMKPKKRGVDAGNRMWLVEQLDKDLEYFGATLTGQGAAFNFVCTVLTFADPKIKDGGRIVRDYIELPKRQRSAELTAKDERDEAEATLWGFILPDK